MKHLIPGLFTVLVIVNTWGDEQLYAAGLTRAQCDDMRYAVARELPDGYTAECRGVSSLPRPSAFTQDGAPRAGPANAFRDFSRPK